MEGGSVSDVHPMVHILLRQSNWFRGNTMHKKLSDVYRNFTSIHKAVISLLENLATKFHQAGSDDLPVQYRDIRENVGMFITFCRWQLNCMLNQDKVRCKTSALLLKTIESNLLMIVKCLTTFSFEQLGASIFSLIFEVKDFGALLTEIELVYEAAVSRNEAPFMPSYNLLIKKEFIMEFLNQVHEDLQHRSPIGLEERKTMSGYLLLLRYYYEFIGDRINGEEMNDFQISSQLLASKMAYYSVLCRCVSLDGKFASARHRIESHTCHGFLRTTSVLPQHVCDSIPGMKDELLIIYVNCIQDNLSDLRKDEAFADLTSPMAEQFTILQSGLSFLVFLLADSGPLTSGQDKLTYIRVRFQALVRNVGSLTVSCFNNEMNGNTSPSLSDVIENLNLIKKECIEILEGNVTEVSEKMHVLRQYVGHYETSDDLHQMLQYVYRNFTSIHKAVIALLENVGGKFHSDLPREYGWMMVEVGMAITFCRWQLHCMLNQDEVRRKTSAFLLEKIERNLFMILKALTYFLSLEQLDPSRIYDLLVKHIDTLLNEIKPIYETVVSRNEVSFMSSHLLITNEFIMEFLNQIYDDLQHTSPRGAEERKTMSGYIVLLRCYFDFIADKINAEEMNDFLISSQLLASKMAYYSFFSRYTGYVRWKEKFTSARHRRIESDIRLGFLRTISVLPQHVFCSILAMKDKLLIIYVNCIQDNLSDLRKDEAFADLTSSMAEKFTILQSGLSFLVFLLADSGPLSAGQEKLSDIRVCFQVLVRNVESLTVSCFNNEMNGSAIPSLSVKSKTSTILLEKIESRLFMIIKDLTDFLSLEQLDPSLINDLRVKHIDSLANEIEPIYEAAAVSRHEASFMPSHLLIANEFIMEFLNQVHQDLQHKVVTGFEEIKTMSGYMVLLRYYFEFIADKINGEELKDFLISSQLVASKIAYYSFFTRYTSPSWDKKFASTRHRIESDIRLGFLRTTSVLPKHVSSSITATMNNELLTIYVNCINDSLLNHLKDKAFNNLTSPTIDPFTILPKGLSMILLPDSELSTAADVEKLSNIRVWFRALRRSVGYLTVTCFNNEMKGYYDFIKRVDNMIEEIIEDIYCIVLGRPGQGSPRTHRLHFFIVLLEDLEDLIENKSNLIMTQKDQSDEVHMNLILLRSFIQNIKGNSNIHEGSENIDELDFGEKDKPMKTLAKKMQLLRNYLHLDINPDMALHQFFKHDVSSKMSELLISAFEMGCNHLFRRDGEVHWWKVTSGPKTL